MNQIQENPYVQYFIGYEGYRDEPPFDSSMMVHFRKRLNLESVSEINEKIFKAQKGKALKRGKKDKNNDNNKGEGASHKGKLIVDTTCAPADIRYPTDLGLLNEAREKAEHIIDVLYEPLKEREQKVRTYRRKARRDYLICAKKKKVTQNGLVKAIGKQLRYLIRDLGHINDLIPKSSLRMLKKKEYKDLLVIHELYRQQKYMYDNRTHKLPGRIVSISQPHVRPIVRGKEASPVEFGAKISVSLINGYSFLDHVSWEPFHESSDLIKQVEKYYERFGYYPQSVHVDKIYRTRDNVLYCKGKGIRITGPALGRPKKVAVESEKEQERIKAMLRRDERYRIPIEGKFGQGKRRFSLDRIMTKLACTSETAICIIFMVMNLEKLLRDIIFFFFEFMLQNLKKAKKLLNFVMQNC